MSTTSAPFYIFLCKKDGLCQKKRYVVAIFYDTPLVNIERCYLAIS